MVAIEHERHDILDYLLKKSVDLYKRESASGNTALHLAAQKGDAEACKAVFKEAPETAVVVNYQGETPIHLAVKA